MSNRRPLNIFYEEPDFDRWLPLDRYPRRILRRLVRGPHQPGGMERVFLNLCAGLDRIGVPYRANDYRYLRNHPEELACVVGKPFVLDRIPLQTPLLFGTSIYNHPLDNPELPNLRPVRRVLVPSPWVGQMFEEVWPGRVQVWPVGIDTDFWSPESKASPDIDVLVYDKIFRYRERLEHELIEPLYALLEKRGLRVQTLRYGTYREDQLHALRGRARSMIYLSRHETQGIAAQQMLSSGIPLFVWDEGGLWQDPKYTPHLVKFGPVSSLPYWDDRCGRKFSGPADMAQEFDRFWQGVEASSFAPRSFILDDFTLEKRAAAYVEIADKFA